MSRSYRVAAPFHQTAKGRRDWTRNRTRTRFSVPALEELEPRTVPSTLRPPGMQFTVTNTNDDTNPGSLRWAITQADSNPGSTIAFSINGGGLQTIAPTSALPALTAAVTLDGTTQPGYAGTPLIQLDGAGAGNANGIWIAGAGVTVRGLDVNRFTYSGIVIASSAATSATVVGNFIGTDPTGTQALGNGLDGVLISAGATSNTIGGTSASARNLISANTGAGVDLQGSGTTGNVVLGNFVGTAANGTAALANTGPGVNLAAAASGNTIGGAVAGAGNVLSGNGTYGVGIQGTGTSANVVAGNLIGTDGTGTHSLGNAFGGVAIYAGATSNTFGGTSAASRNLISGNTSHGVALSSTGTTGNLVEGNYVGTDVTGVHPLGNGANGVVIYNGASGNTIGGTVTAAVNVLSGNASDGVVIQDSGTTANLVAGNLIGTDPTGANPVGNVSGVVLSNASGNMVGGAGGARNVISGNSYAGVVLVNGASGNLVQGNSVGTDVTGTKAVANSGFGVLVYYAATGNTLAGNLVSGNGGTGVEITGSGTNTNLVQGNLIGTDSSGAHTLANAYYGVGIENSASSNTIGGTAAGQANTIAFNAAAGVWVGSGTGNSVRGNSIYSNGGLGIDLAPAGPNANQPGGGGSGPNNLQDYPVFSSATVNGNTATVQGSFPATPNTAYALDFYANPGAGFSAYYQGQTYLGSLSVTANSAGVASFQATFTDVPTGQTYLTATATDPAGDTSEFCLPFASTADVANYITATQLANGAVRQSLNPGEYVGSTPAYEIDPYFADQAVQGLLATSAGGSVDPRTAAQNYFLWYLGHLNADGTIDNYWYYADGTQAPGSMTPDSNDAYASTFLSAVWQFYLAGGSPSFFQASGVQSELNQVGNVLLNVQLANGLTQTFLPGNGPEYTYTEDNSESYAGYLAMAQIEAQVYGNTAASQTYAAAASHCQSGIMTYLYNSSTGLFKIDPNTPSDTTQWNPGTIVLAWPILYGVVSPTGSVAQAQMAAIDTAWNGGSQQDWTTRTDSAAVGFAAVLTGDTTRGQEDIATLARDPYPTPLVSPPGALFTVADPGWLLRAMQPSANHLGVSGPAASTAGTSFTLTVTALDPYGNVSTGYRGTVHLTSTDPHALLPPDHPFTAADNGTYTFTVTLVTAGAQTVTATDTYTAITGSGSLTVNPGAATTLSVSAASPETAGKAFSVIVTALDAYGNVATGYLGKVKFTSSDPQAKLPAPYLFVTGDKGQHTFTTVTLKTAGSQTVTVTDTAHSTIKGSVSVTVNPAAASHFQVSAPASVKAGTAFSVTVTALDPYGNVATGYLGKIHFTSSDTASGRVLPPDYKFNATDKGVHTFNGVILITVGTQTITATDSAKPTIKGTATIQVTAGAPGPSLTGGGPQHDLSQRARDPVEPEWAGPSGGGRVPISPVEVWLEEWWGGPRFFPEDFFTDHETRMLAGENRSAQVLFVFPR